jgi:hypothetical protein
LKFQTLMGGCSENRPALSHACCTHESNIESKENIPSMSNQVNESKENLGLGTETKKSHYSPRRLIIETCTYKCKYGCWCSLSPSQYKHTRSNHRHIHKHKRHTHTVTFMFTQNKERRGALHTKTSQLHCRRGRAQTENSEKRKKWKTTTP